MCRLDQDGLTGLRTGTCTIVASSPGGITGAGGDAVEYPAIETSKDFTVLPRLRDQQITFVQPDVNRDLSLADDGLLEPAAEVGRSGYRRNFQVDVHRDVVIVMHAWEEFDVDAHIQELELRRNQRAETGAHRA